MTNAIRVRACLAVVQDGKILLVPHFKDDGGVQWAVPGGKVEFGEGVEDAAAREFLEETGLHAEVVDLLTVSEVILPERPYHSIAISFLGRVLDGGLRPEPDHPYGDKVPKWFSAADVAEVEYHPSRTVEEALGISKAVGMDQPPPKMIIFDYGRTLFDRESDQLFPDARSTVAALAGDYRLAIVSVSSPEEEEGRLAVLREAGILDCFESIRFVPDGEAKAAGYERLLADSGLSPAEVAVVDDFAVRGIDWGNRVGALTFWFPNGRFADVAPQEPPTHTIQSLGEIPGLLAQLHTDR